MDKTRKLLIEKRQNIQNRVQKEKAIVEKLLPFLTWTGPVGIYSPVRGEADPFKHDGRFLYPKVREDGSMIFARPPLEKGSFSITEPTGKEEIPSLVFVPLVGFWHTWRMGYGGGYYDRWIREHPDTITVGIAFDEQEHEFQPHEGDEALDWIITPTRILKREKR